LRDDKYYPGKVFKKADILDCDFDRSSATVIIATNVADADQDSTSRPRCPSVTIFYTTYNEFMVISSEDAEAWQMRANECDIHWTASGFLS
jgi:hypothetical protein